MTTRHRRWGAVIVLFSMLFTLGIWRFRRHGTDDTATRRSGLGDVEANPPTSGDIIGNPMLLRGAAAGRVSQSSGAPVMGASVCAWDATTWCDSGEPSRCTETSADGRYRLDELAVGEYQIGASAANLRSTRWLNPDKTRDGLGVKAGETRENIDLILAEGGIEVRGRVQDIGGGPVVSAMVSVFAPEPSEAPPDDDHGKAVVRSDARGEWKAWVPAGRIHAVAIAEGYAETWAHGMAPGPFIDMVLTPESVLQGRVVQAGTDAPVAGARVSTGGISRFVASGASVRAASTDAEGRFRISHLEPGRYKPEAATAQRWGVARESVLLGVAETSEEVRIEAHATAAASGRVVASNGRPCAEGTVSAREQSTNDSLQATIGDDGRARLEGLLPGRYDVLISCRGAVSEDAYEPLAVADKDLTGLIWNVKPGFTVRGIVVDSKGQPVASAEVYAQAKRSDPRAPRRAVHGTTGLDGAFELRGLLPATHAIGVIGKAGSPEKDPIEINVERDMDGVRLVRPASAAADAVIEGTVVDRAGAPIAGMPVEAQGRREGWEHSLTLDNGTFVIKGLRPGEYRVSCGSGSRMPAPGTREDDAPGTWTTVRAKETARVKLVVESPNGEIRGRVLEPGGQPITDAFIDARRGLREEPERAAVLTDMSGNFTLTKLSPGSYVVRAHRKGGGEAALEGVRIGSRVTLTIRPTATVAGTVVGSHGKGLERFTVEATDAKAGVSRTESFFRTGGAFVLRDLPAGDFQMSAKAPEGRARNEVRLATGENRQGVRLEMEGTTSLRGRVVSMDTGEPVAGVRVMVQSAKASSEALGFRMDGDQRFVSDAEGRFEVANCPAGRVMIRTIGPHFDYASIALPARLEARPISERPPLRLPRGRFKGQDRMGDLGFTVRENAPDVEIEQTRWQVNAVRPGSAAANAGLQVDDEILSVEGHDVVGANGYLYAALTRVSEGTVVTLGLRRGASIAIRTERRSP